MKNILKVSAFKLLLTVLLFGSFNVINAQTCTINAGTRSWTICEGEPFAFDGQSPTGTVGGIITWTQVGGPGVVISDINSPTSSVLGMIGGNTYTFVLSANCTTETQDVTIAVQPITQAEAGLDADFCPDTGGNIIVNGNTPQLPGETGSWVILSDNDAGLTIDFPNSSTTTISMPPTSCGQTTIAWIIEGPEYAPGQSCESRSEIVITNFGGVEPVDAGFDQSLGNCYSSTQATDLDATFGGCDPNVQIGTWTFVSGPSTPVFSDINNADTRISNLIEGTYELRWTVVGPCSESSDTMTITVPAPTQDVTGGVSGPRVDLFLCDNGVNSIVLEGQIPEFSGETVSWTQTGGTALPPGSIVSPNSSSTLISNLVSPGNPYTFVYTVTNNNTGCGVSREYQVDFRGSSRTVEANSGNDLYGACGQTVFQIPVVSTGTGNTSYRILSGPADSPLAPFPTSFSSPTALLDIELIEDGAYTLEFVRSEGGQLPVGCTDGFDTMNVFVSGVSGAPNAGTDFSIVCGQTVTTIVGNLPQDGTPLWTQISGPQIATIVSPYATTTDITGLTPGEYVFQYEFLGGSNCPSVADQVTIFSSSATVSTASAAGPNQSVCVSSQVALDGNVPALGEFGTWTQISGPDTVTFSDVNDPKALITGLNTASATYQFQWTIDYISPGPSGCASATNDTVDVLTSTDIAPGIVAAGVDACFSAGGSPINLAADAVGVGETGTWSVLPNTGVSITDVNDPNTAVSFASDGTYEFTWTVTNGTVACTPSFDTVSITLADTADANAGSDQLGLCSSTANLAATISDGATGEWTYVSGPGGFSFSDVTDPNAVVSFQFSGTYIFEWTATAGSCSNDSDQVTIEVGIPPTIANAGPDQDICNSTSVVLGANDFTNGSELGIWSVLSGAPSNPNIVNPSQFNTTVTGLETGIYTFRWTISSIGTANCPPSFDDVVVEVYEGASLGSDIDLCDVTSFLLEGTSNTTGTWTQISGPSSPTATITQVPGGGPIANVDISASGPGVYEFQYEADSYSFVSGGNCPTSADVIQVEISSRPSIDPIAGPDQTICTAIDTSITLDGNDPPVDGTTAEWVIVFEPTGSTAAFLDATDPDTQLTGLTTEGIYVLEWRFSNENCVVLADVVRFEVYNPPAPVEAGDDNAQACIETYFTNATAPTSGIGQWSITTAPVGSSTTVDSPNNPITSLSNIELGTYVLTWEVSNGPFMAPSLCAPQSDTVTITFNDIAPTAADAGPDQLLCEETETNLAAVPVISGVGTWSQTAGATTTITAPNNPNSLILGLTTGTYEYTWTSTTSNDDGCSFSDTVLIEVTPGILGTDAGPDASYAQFDPVSLAANTPAEGTGTWTQISGPSTAGFIGINDPNTALTGLVVGAYVFDWTVENGICPSASDQVTITILGIADLRLDKSASSTTGNVGDTVTFTITLENEGPGDAADISVEDILPNGFDIVGGTISNGGVYNPGSLTITWNNLSVTNGGTQNLTYDVTVNDSGNYTNVAEVTQSDSVDPDSTPGNDDGDQSEDDETNETFTIQTADLSLVKSVSPTTASVGETVTFTLEVSNAGTANATGVAISDLVPSGYTIGTVNNGGTVSGNQITWSGLTVNDASATSVSFEATVNTPTGTANEYNNTAEITASDVLDPDSAPNNDDGDQSEDDESSAGIALDQVDLQLNIANTPTSGNPGDTVTYNVYLFNDDIIVEGDATGVEVVIQVPSGFTIVTGTISNGGVYNPGDGTITWSNVSVNSGDTESFTYDVTVNTSGNFDTTGQITASDLPDVDSTPNNDDGDQSEDDEAIAPFALQSADLSLVKGISSASSATPNIGDTVVFELTVTNAGPDTATNVVIEDEVPRGYTLVTVNDGGTAIAGTFLSWDILNFPVGSTTLSYEVSVNAASGDVDEYLNITEVAASDQADPDSEPFNDDGDQDEDDEDFFEITPQLIDLELLKAVSDSNPNVDDIVTFTIAVSNLGDVPATGVSITDVLPVGYGTVTSISNGGSFGAGTITWSGLTVPLGSNTLSLTFNAQVLAPTGVADEYKNNVEIAAADQFDTDSTPNNDDGDQSEDDESTISVLPQISDLSLTKTANIASPNVGDTVIFTLTVNNLGPNIATGVALEDLLPAGFTLTAVNDGGTLAGNIASWSGLTVLANGGSTSVTYEATVNAPTGAVDEYLNEASITASDQFDPDSDPNTGNTVDEDGDGQTDDDDEVALVVAPNLADLSLTKIVVDGDTSPQVGTEISFEITVFNDGPDDANDVVVEDLLPSGFDFVLYSSTSGVYNPTSGIWQVGDISSGGTETLVIDVLVNPTGNYTNVAEVIASDVFDIDSTPNNDILAEDDQDDVTVTPINTIDVSLDKAVSNETPDVNTDITFTITVTNEGPSVATNLQILDQLPSGFTYVSDDAAGAYNDTNGNWNIGNLGIGGTAILNIVSTVNTTGVYINEAEVVSHTELDIDSTPNNDILSEDDQDEVVVSPRQLVDISVTKVADNMTPNIGGPIDFTITVTNDGPSDATNIVVTDLLESGYEFVSATTSNGIYEPLNGSWTIGDLDNGITETITITATVLSTGTYTNTAELTDLNEFDIDSEASNNDDTEDDQETIEPTPVLVSDLELTKAVNVATPFVGDEVIFTLSLTNNGPSDANGVEVVDLLPDGYTYVSNNSTAGVYNETNGLWSLNGVIPNGTTETLNIVVLVNPIGNYSNIAEITGSDNNDIDSTPANNIANEDDQDNADTTPTPLADLSLVKTVDNEFPDVSDNVTFTLTLSNAGPSPATGIQVNETLPSGYAYISDDSGGLYDPGTGIWDVASLAADATRALNITVGINTTGSYANVAEVIAVNELDPNSTPDNNDINEDDQDEQVTLPRVITDISVLKTIDNLSPSAGSQVTFTITVTNDGPSDATGLVVEDILASGYDFLGATPSAGTYDEIIGSWDIATLLNGASETLDIVATVLTNGDYSNTAELIALDTFDPDSSPDNNLNSEDDQDTVNPVPTGLADLSLTKTVDDDNPNVGDIIEFTINLTNSGDSNASGVVVTDLLPIGFSYESHFTTAGIYDEDTGIWNTNGVIPNGTTETLVVLATVNPPTGIAGEYINLAEITASNQADPDSEVTSDGTLDDLNDGLLDDDEASVEVIPQSTDISLQKTVDNPRPGIGAEIVFTITVTNNGNGVATNLGIEELLPSGYRFISASTSAGDYDSQANFWELASLEGSNSATLELTVEVLETDDYLNVINLAFVDQYDTDTSNDTAQVSIEPTCLIFYNEFSPNGDGVNETFKIDCISRYPNNVLKVFNRWGNIVYEQQGYSNDWDGTSNGRATINKEDFLPVGTYFYILELGDGSEPISDWLYINR